MTRQVLGWIAGSLILVFCAARDDDSVNSGSTPPGSNQVYVKVFMPRASVESRKERPVVESWIAQEVEKRGQAEVAAVTEWVSLDLSPLAATDVWDGQLGDRHHCPVGADIPLREDGRIEVLLGGWHPGGAEVVLKLEDEPGGRAIVEVEDLKEDGGVPLVAVLIGPPAA